MKLEKFAFNLPRPNSLTLMHFEILAMRGNGMSVSEIALRSNISIDYVQDRMFEIFEKVITSKAIGTVIDAFEDATSQQDDVVLDFTLEDLQILEALTEASKQAQKG